MRLLSVDWDYFFPKVERIEDGELPNGKNVFFMYDWGHKESGIFISYIWPHRAADFVRAGLELPKTSGLEREFWSRFRFSPHATMFYAESHSQAADPRVMRNVTEVWSYDAHHDAGYDADKLQDAMQRGHVTCEDWLAYYVIRGSKASVVYPKWRDYAVEEEIKPVIQVDRVIDNGKSVPVTFDRVFVCRSGAWVPPWVDSEFDAFIKAAPMQRKRQIGDEMADRSGWREAMEQSIEAVEAAIANAKMEENHKCS